MTKRSADARSVAKQKRGLLLLPASLIGRSLACTWLSACLAVLLFAYAKRGVHDMPQAFGWLMNILSFPLGLIAMAITGALNSALMGAIGVPYQPFRDELPLWLAAVVVGYCQWFVVVPFVARYILVRRKHGA